MSEVKEHPIIFGAESVRGILSGAKTQTRRVIKGQPNEVHWGTVVVGNHQGWIDDHGKPVLCRFSEGERLWVKETWTHDDAEGHHYRPFYKADYGLDGGPSHPKWRSPLFMPRSANRITLEISDLRVERLQAISEEDAIAEGIMPGKFGGFCIDEDCESLHSHASGAYLELWDTLNAKRGFPAESDPWVWVLEFRRVTA